VPDLAGLLAHSNGHGTDLGGADERRTNVDHKQKLPAARIIPPFLVHPVALLAHDDAVALNASHELT